MHAGQGLPVADHAAFQDPAPDQPGVGRLTDVDPALMQQMQSPWLSVSNKQLELMGRYMAELGITPAWHTEVESRRRNDRPELEKALGLAKLTGATLVIAKLDRLSRNAAFLLTLRDSGVRFVACDLLDRVPA